MRFFIAIVVRAAGAAYAVMKAVVPVRHKVVFLSRQSNEPSKDFLMLAAALRQQDPDLQVVMSTRMLGSGPIAAVRSLLVMVRQMYELASAEACVVDGYVIPVSVLTHRPGFFVVQMWHAVGAIKKFGYQTLDLPGGHSAGIAESMRMHRNYSLVLCGGDAMVPIFAEAFDVDPSVVTPIGLPRLDVLLRSGLPDDPSDRVRARLEKEHPILAERERTVVLYAPTFRARSAGRYQDVTDAFAGSKYTLMVKPHPLESEHVSGANVVSVGTEDVSDLLPMCDVVITDYSAVAFEACVVGRPVFFWVYDIDDYAQAVGLNVDLFAEFPEVTFRDFAPIASHIAAGEFHPEASRRMKERYLSAADGVCTERIAHVILENLQGRRS